MSEEGSTAAAVMFADVVGSTWLYEKLGDERAHAEIASCLKWLSGIVEQGGGVVIQTIGDEALCRFASADAAITVACKIQESIGAETRGDRPAMQVRIGMHYGPVMFKQGTLYGDTVNVAARMTAIARAKQIFTTEATVKNLSPENRKKAREFDRIVVKGKQDEMVVYQIIWERDAGGLTSVIPVVRTYTPPQVKLQLRYRDKTIELTEDDKAIVAGRNPQCEIPVQLAAASRLHARFEYRRGKIILIDLSTNGTFVRTQDGALMFLHREELALSGEGVISLGVPIAKESEHLLYYKCE